MIRTFRIITTIIFLLGSSCIKNSQKDNFANVQISDTNNKLPFVEEKDIIKDSSIIRYIKEQRKDCTALIDLQNLPQIFQPLYKNILVYLSSHNMNQNNYYVSIKGIQEDSTSFYIPFYHYDGMKKRKELDDKNNEARKRSKGYPYTITIVSGNIGGKNGSLKIDKRTKKIILFGYWN